MSLFDILTMLKNIETSEKIVAVRKTNFDYRDGYDPRIIDL